MLSDIPVHVARVDAVRHETLAQTFDVAGFPTLLLLRASTGHEEVARAHRGERLVSVGETSVIAVQYNGARTS